MAYERDRHHRVSHTCEVTGKDTRGRKVRVLVQGRAAEVRARIEARVQAGAQRMTFTDVETGSDVVVSLAVGDLVAVR